METDLRALRLHAHFDEGHGPAIVMLHGINSDGGDWRTVIDTIGPGYRFVALDLLGFGQSPKPTDIEYTADEHALVIENTLVDLGVDEPFLMVGYSLGGDIALRYASTYPHRLRRLFLLDAPFYLPPEALQLRATGLRYMYEVVSKRLWDLLGASKSNNSLVYRLATGVGEKSLEEAFHASDIPTHWDIMNKNLTNTVNAATWVDDLPKLSMPVVHAIGVRDAIVKVSQAPALKRLKPDLEIRRISGLAADHMVLWNMPERVAHEIMRDEIRGLNVAWRGGTGEPLMLLHGLQHASLAWQPIAESLALRHDVAIVDLLGFGGSPGPLSMRYTLADHSAAVWGTARALWGDSRPVVFVGEGLGASIALSCAATVPERSAKVIAFAPTLLDADTSLDDLAGDERAEQAVAIRDLARRIVEDERAGSRHAEQLEARLVPLTRSIEHAVLGTDARALLSDVPSPCIIVSSPSDLLVPHDLLAELAGQRDGFESVTIEGFDTPYDSPSDAVGLVLPRDTEAARAAEIRGPAPESESVTPLRNATGGVEGSLMRAGVLNLAAAVAVLLIHPVPKELLTAGFGLWVTVASVSAIVGALGMSRGTVGSRFTFVTTALPTLLAGIGGLLLAAFVFSAPESAGRLLATLVAVYAMVRGVADLYVARRVEGAATPRWMLYLGGVMGIVTGLAIVFGPNEGRGVVRIALAVYLIGTGIPLLGYATAVRRGSRRRVDRLTQRLGVRRVQGS